ncbi:DUF3810 domain-containing protein [Alkaliphilus sp. B6464]|uniref:DUF3810 domain-containing protein n=1 Tax=Alkaliphilus sp. B6464 TaxID=2731219 RepID=UPI001BEEE1DA|nr:DUF3810 domain-containing protein [Alkaliphilus sp. B6464]QUH21307.1 DUF3810 domain-containing protein [Alkaliphilus sp. B6464]
MNSLLIIDKFKSKRKSNLLLVLIMILLCFSINKFMGNHQEILERYYSGTINKWIIQGVSQITGILPFSLAEILYVGHLIMIPVIVVLFIYKLLKGGFLQFFYKVLSYICVVYVIFMLMWGFNYSRMPIGAILDLQTESYSKEELYKLNEALIEKANILRIDVPENSDGVMHLAGGYKDIFSRAFLGYETLGKTVKVLSGNYGGPKPIILSKPMLYTGITGMYFPFTAEANVNTATSNLLLPATVLHEMAHQRGFASEDEANYIAYLTASAHPDIDFQYSGTILALIHSMNALSVEDAELAANLSTTYSDELKRDIRSYTEFWKGYKGKVNETANRVNDTYLKINGEKEGTKSYGRMVDLLLAHFIKHGEI